MKYTINPKVSRETLNKIYDKIVALVDESLTDNNDEVLEWAWKKMDEIEQELSRRNNITIQQSLF